MASLWIGAEQRASYRYLARWIVVALMAGLLGSSVLAGFRFLLEWGLASVSRLPPPAVAAGAAAVAGLVIYRISPDAAGEGIPSYLYSLSRADSHFPVKVTLWKIPAALLTLVGFGSGGAVGPVGRTVAGIMSIAGGRGERFDPERARTAAICGMAATVAALLHAPIAGGIFAAEIVQRANMRYRELFPAVLAGAASVWFSRLVGWQPLFRLDRPVDAYAIGVTPWLIVFALVVGALGGLYVRGYALAVRLFRRDQGRVALKVVAGMVGASALVWLVNPAVAGTAATLTQALVNGEAELVTMGNLLFQSAVRPLWFVALVLLCTRAFASYLTTGSGMSAGLTGPAMQIGLLAGLVAAATYASFVSRTTTPGVLPSASPEGLAFLVVGLTGMLAGAMNVPIAAAVLGVEIFGIAFSIPAVFASVIAFQMNRHQTIYDYALAGSGHLNGADAPVSTGYSPPTRERRGEPR